MGEGRGKWIHHFGLRECYEPWSGGMKWALLLMLILVGDAGRRISVRSSQLYSLEIQG
jgi:hypothetical protein